MNDPRHNELGFIRQVWLGVVALAVIVFGTFLVTRAMQVDEDVHTRYRDALLIAQHGLEAQLLLAELQQGPAEPRPVVAALRRKISEIGRHPLTGAEHQHLGDVQRLVEAAEFNAAAAQRPAAVAAADRALLALVTSIRDRTEAVSADTHRFRDLALYTVLGLVVVTVALAATLLVLAMRALSAHRERLGQLDQMAHEDALTGVVNRRRLDETLPIELARAQRLGYPLTVAMLDLDHFKRFNDRRGHGAGDSLLREAAQAWRRQLRPTDLLARYGGEEFTLVLPACDATQACQLVDRLRPLVPEKQTFSAGVALWNGHDEPGELLRVADVALLQAKRTGRNRTVVAGAEPQGVLPLRVVS